jgi:uncharacterized protein
MKWRFPLFAMWCAIASGNIAQAQDPNVTGKSLLWKITGNHLPKPCYLYGTIHMICARDYMWTDKMNESLLKTDEVCFEMNLSDPMVLFESAMAMVDTGGKSLQDYFTPAQYKLLAQYVRDSMGMDIALFQNVKPVVLEMLFAKGVSGCDSPVSAEERIMAIAQKEQKQIVGMETAAEQVAVLSTIPTDSVVKEIMDALQPDMEKTPSKESSKAQNEQNEYDRLLTAYKNQDLPALYAIINESKNELGGGLDKFLDDRNKKWIPRMKKMMEEKPVFFAVGAGHLWGENGVISLLRKDGYTVTAVR